MSFPVIRHTLDNGLRVVVSPDHVTPSVAVCLWYDVGSRDEVPGKTGFAHLFEHLMFQGSANVGPNEHFGILQSIGATLNGTTSFDRTNYYETVPAHELATALWLEADRMGTLADALDQASLDNQRDVVKNERRQRYDNVPYGTMSEQLVPKLFPAGHPYDHLPIGSMADLDAASLEDAISFWRSWYGPNNAVLALVGDVEPEAALAEVEKYFGTIPRIPQPAPRRTGAMESLPFIVRHELHEQVPAQRHLSAWRIPADETPESDALELAATLLTTGDASRLTSRLVHESQQATSVGAGMGGLVGGVSWFQIVATARENAALEDLEKVIIDELESLAAAGPSEAELDRAKAQVEREVLQALGTQQGRADILCRSTVFFDEPGRINTLVERLLAPTVEDVRNAVATYLRADSRVVLDYVLEPAAPLEVLI